MVRRTIAVGLVGVAWLVLTGYFEPLPLLMDKTAKTMAVWRGLKVEGTRLLIDESGGRRLEPFVFQLSRPDRARLETPAADGSRAVEAPRLEPAHQRLADLLLRSSDKARLFNDLAKRGVRLDMMSLSRLGKTVCAVVGAAEGDEQPSQLWVEKFAHRPARLILAPTADQSRRFDVQLNEWDHPLTAGVFPRRVKFFIDDRLVEEWTVERVTRGAAF
ncbi:MAG: hypothetical protein C4523_13190 [Myxococcales bacterium]|nr:MAG: hypothetical protein C4523_13190 [Myxococcales bacterium]